jgi:hypothetical protein
LPSSKAAALLPLHRRGHGRDAAFSSGALASETVLLKVEIAPFY